MCLEELISGRIQVPEEKSYVVAMQNTKPLTTILNLRFFLMQLLISTSRGVHLFYGVHAFPESGVSTGIRYHWIFK